MLDSVIKANKKPSNIFRRMQICTRKDKFENYIDE